MYPFADVMVAILSGALLVFLVLNSNGSLIAENRVEGLADEDSVVSIELLT